MRSQSVRQEMAPQVGLEDTFLPYDGPNPVPARELKIDSDKTGHLNFHVNPNDLAHDVALPVIFLQNGQILLPQSRYQDGKQVVDYWVFGRGH